MSAFRKEKVDQKVVQNHLIQPMYEDLASSWSSFLLSQSTTIVLGHWRTPRTNISFSVAVQYAQKHTGEIQSFESQSYWAC